MAAKKNRKPATGPTAVGIVKQVVDRIAGTIDHCGCGAESRLKSEMSKRYLPGFEAALENNRDFWKENKTKVLRMAGHAGAMASFLAEREHAGSLRARKSKPEVEVEHLMMAMGTIRTACFVAAPGQTREQVADARRGLPCNYEYFAIPSPTKERIVGVLAALAVELLTEDSN